MKDAVSIPVTVKTRLGVDEQESYGFLTEFVGTVAESGCSVFIIHARKAWLSGLSPKQNREIPELRYDRVSRLKSEFPQLTIILNGGIATAAEAECHLQSVDGIMLGRAAYHDPWILAELQQKLFGNRGVASRDEAVHALTAYISRQKALGIPVKHISRHVLGLFQGLPGAKRWRRHISQHAHRDDSNDRLLLQALAAMRPQQPETSGSASRDAA